MRVIPGGGGDNMATIAEAFETYLTTAGIYHGECDGTHLVWFSRIKVPRVELSGDPDYAALLG